tara:strand:+ start:268 stop:690 length:423 start_codon:yes stop_codon:yes gene_type:complete
MIKSVGGIIFVNGKYLVQLRDNKKNIFFPGFWGVFGGLVEKGEKLSQALVREIKEETGLTVKVTKMIISNGFKVLSFEQKRQRVFYECEIVGKNKIVLREGKKYRFISYNELKTLNVVPLDFAAINYHYLWKVKKFKHLP